MNKKKDPLFQAASAFVGRGCIASDEERLVLSKPVVHFSFTYGVLRALVYNYLTLITSLFTVISTNVSKKDVTTFQLITISRLEFHFSLGRETPYQQLYMEGELKFLERDKKNTFILQSIRVMPRFFTNDHIFVNFSFIFVNSMLIFVIYFCELFLFL